MRLPAAALACTFAFLFSWSAGQAAPLDAYGELPTLDTVSLSADGTKLAYIGEKNGDRFVVIQEIAGSLIAAIKIGDQKVRGIGWADATHVIITSSVTQRPDDFIGRDEWFEAFVFDTVSKRQFNLLSHGVNYQMNAIEGDPEVRSVDGKTIAYVRGLTDAGTGGWLITLFAVDVDTGTQTEARKGKMNDFVVDSGGTVVAEDSYEGFPGHWKLRLHASGQWKEIYDEDAAIDVPRLVGISPDGTSLEVIGRKGGQYMPLAFALSDGHPVTPVLSGRGYPVFDPGNHRIIGERLVGYDVIYRFFEGADRVRWSRIVSRFPSEMVEYESMSADHNKFVVHVVGARDGDVHVLIDSEADTAVLVGPTHRRVAPQDIARVTQFTYAAADGRQIDAFLTLPSGRPAEKLALIVMPHGGPEARDEPGFDWWAQAYASMGYAVLQPQFRGSGRWGWDLFSAGFGELGRKMQTDLSDGVRALARGGIIDPAKVCIVGASYGGYAALAGAAIDRGVYRCAVAIAGVSDPGYFLEGARRYRVTRYWSRYLGTDSSSDPILDTISPRKHAADISIPVMLMYGEDDTVVPIEQSKDMADALKKAGKPYELVVLQKEDHWFSRAATRTQMLKSSAAFLMAHNPP